MVSEWLRRWCSARRTIDRLESIPGVESAAFSQMAADAVLTSRPASSRSSDATTATKTFATQRAR